MNKKTSEYRWVYSLGGMMGPHLLLKKGDLYVGHMYLDPSPGCGEADLEALAPIERSEKKE